MGLGSRILRGLILVNSRDTLGISDMRDELGQY
jgi:hypothetical protein